MLFSQVIQAVFDRHKQDYPKMFMEKQRDWTAKIILKKRGMWDITVLETRAYRNAAVIEAVKY